MALNHKDMALPGHLTKSSEKERGGSLHMRMSDDEATRIAAKLKRRLNSGKLEKLPQAEPLNWKAPTKKR